MKSETLPPARTAEIVATLDAAIARIAGDVLRGTPTHLAESILYSLTGPGKRIRPRFVIAVGEALGLPREISDSIATAIEMTHAYTLIHDDLPAMDDDDFRRGRPTNHKVYGEGIAVLAGDSLAMLGPDVLLRLQGRLPADRVIALALALIEASGARGVVAGQAAEAALGERPAGDLAGLLEIFRKKTGALFRAALTLPAIAAGVDSELIARLGNLGDDLGIAFQIADDLEDDFAAKKSDAAHIAAYLDLASARREALRRLEIDPGFSPPIRERLAPFVAEMRDKVGGETI
jgi:geranylgeranyl pyrophosphate synthase